MTSLALRGLMPLAPETEHHAHLALAAQDALRHAAEHPSRGSWELARTACEIAGEVESADYARAQRNLYDGWIKARATAARTRLGLET